MIQMLDQEIPLPAPVGARLLLYASDLLKRWSQWLGALAFKWYGKPRAGWRSVQNRDILPLTESNGIQGGIRIDEEWSVSSPEHFGKESDARLWFKVLDVGADRATIRVHEGADTWTQTVPVKPGTPR